MMPERIERDRRSKKGQRDRTGCPKTPRVIRRPLLAGISTRVGRTRHFYCNRRYAAATCLPPVCRRRTGTGRRMAWRSQASLPAGFLHPSGHAVPRVLKVLFQVRLSRSGVRACLSADRRLSRVASWPASPCRTQTDSFVTNRHESCGLTRPISCQNVARSSAKKAEVGCKRPKKELRCPVNTSHPTNPFHTSVKA